MGSSLTWALRGRREGRSGKGTLCSLAFPLAAAMPFGPVSLTVVSVQRTVSGPRVSFCDQQRGIETPPLPLSGSLQRERDQNPNCQSVLQWPGRPELSESNQGAPFVVGTREGGRFGELQGLGG